MTKETQSEMPGFGSYSPELGNRNSIGADKWYYLYKPITDEMVILDDTGKFVWTPRDTIGNTPHLFNTRALARLAQRTMKLSVITLYTWRKL